MTTTTQVAVPATARTPMKHRYRRAPLGGARGWILFFLAFQICCQLALLRPEFQPLRKYIRGASFGINLFLLVVVGGKLHLELLGKLLMLAVGVLVVGIFHPDTYTLGTAIGVVVFYLSVFASTFWVSRLRIDLNTLRLLMIAFWAFHAISSSVGVLQTYFPGQFQGAISSMVESSPYGIDGLTIQLDSGVTILRPMGLTDSPGGAAVSGMYACLMGMALLLDRRYRWWGLVFAAGMIAGMYCLLLCQLRVFVVTLGVCVIVFLAVLAYRGEGERVAKLSGWLGLIVVLASLWAVSIGREAVTSRLGSLIESDPLSVYQGNRGQFLEYTFRYVIWEHPLGAGLGRWGMVNAYFGDPAESLWSEINWTAWCYDGGIALMLVMAATMGWAVYRAFVITDDQTSPEWRVWGAMLVAYNLGFIATTFCANPLLSQIGVEYFLMNAVIFAAWVQHRRSDSPASTTVARRNSCK